MESKEPENVWESQHKQYEKMLSDSGITPKSQKPKNEQKTKNEQRPKRTLHPLKTEIPPRPKPEIPKPRPRLASISRFRPPSARGARPIRELV
jgi:hypothetical protein